MADSSSVKITQRRSSAGMNARVRETLRSLGLKRIGRTVERPDGPQLRGMIRVVQHLVEVGDREPGSRSRKRDQNG